MCFMSHRSLLKCCCLIIINDECSTLVLHYNAKDIRYRRISQIKSDKVNSWREYRPGSAFLNFWRERPAPFTTTNLRIYNFTKLFVYIKTHPQAINKSLERVVSTLRSIVAELMSIIGQLCFVYVFSCHNQPYYLCLDKLLFA